MTFQWSDISLLSHWWLEASTKKKEAFRELLREGRFEIVTGAWVNKDQAVASLYSMLDQLIEGLFTLELVSNDAVALDDDRVETLH
jgi:hypothetical protein